MNIIIWLVVGLIAGWLASIIMKTNGRQGVIGDIIMGIIGAFVGGWVVGLFGLPKVDGLNLYSVGVAVVGAIIVIAIGRMLFRGTKAVE